MTVDPAVAAGAAERAKIADAVARANAQLSIPERIERYAQLEDRWIPAATSSRPP